MRPSADEANANELGGQPITQVVIQRGECAHQREAHAESFNSTGFRRCAMRLRMVTQTLAAFGLKNRDQGASTAKATVPASVISERTNDATRRLLTSTISDGTIRPARPPMWSRR